MRIVGLVGMGKHAIGQRGVDRGAAQVGAGQQGLRCSRPLRLDESDGLSTGQ